MRDRELRLTGTEMQDSGTPAPFHWQRSDISFAFNFSPDLAPDSPQGVMDPNEAPPGRDEGPEAGPGFAFNFQIPAGTEQESDLKPGAGKAAKSEEVRDSGASADLKPKARKKKKKKPVAGGGEKGVPEKDRKEEAPKQEKTELTPEQQLSRELDWCIEQLELGLRTQKSSTKQKEEACRALKTLRSSKAPIVKKRQVMRAVSGDYRKKMEEERERQHKLIHLAMSSVKVTRVSEPRCKAVYHRRSEPHAPPARSTDTTEVSLSAEQTDGDGVGDKFVFRPSGEEFCFNFNL